ncbi:MAG: hypothetical protein AB7N70_22635 [Dehalococcoidia bacterium]
MSTAHRAFPRTFQSSRNRYRAFLALLGCVLLLAACQTTSPFEPRAYEIATATKAEALALMDKAAKPATRHRKAIETLRLNLDRGYEFARGRPKNDEATRQWAILRDPDGHSIGGFLARWQREGQLDPAFIAEAKRLVSQGFDQVIALEGGKPRAAP